MEFLKGKVAQMRTRGEEHEQPPQEEKAETPQTDLKAEGVGEENRGNIDSREGLETESPQQRSEHPMEADSETRDVGEGVGEENRGNIDSREGLETEFPQQKSEYPTEADSGTRDVGEGVGEENRGNIDSREGLETGFPQQKSEYPTEADSGTRDVGEGVGEENRGNIDSREGLQTGFPQQKSEHPTEADSETRDVGEGYPTGMESKEGVEQHSMNAEDPGLDSKSPKGYLEKPQESGEGDFLQTEGKQTKEEEVVTPQGGETTRDWKPTEAAQESRPRVDYGGLPEPTRPAGAVLLEDQRYSAPVRNKTKNTTAPAQQTLESSAPGESDRANEDTAVYPDETKEGSSKDGMAAGIHTQEKTREMPTEGVQDEKSPEFSAEGVQEEKSPGFTAEGVQEEKSPEVPTEDVQQEKPGLMAKIKSKLPGGHKHTADKAIHNETPAAEENTPARQETTDNLDSPIEATPGEVDNAHSPSTMSKLKDKFVPNRLKKKDGADNVDNVESPVAA